MLRSLGNVLTEAVSHKKESTERNLDIKGETTPFKYKVRCCFRGILETEGIDYFETYTHGVHWSIIRLVLTMIISNGCLTKQVYHTNTGETTY